MDHNAIETRLFPPAKAIRRIRDLIIAAPVIREIRHAEAMSDALVPGGLIIGLVIIFLLHLAMDGTVSPVSQALSDVIFMRHGALALGTATVAIMAASACVLRIASRSGIPVRRPVVALLSGWLVGLAGTIVFPTYQVGGPITLVGQLHRWSALLAFVCLPAAGCVLAHRLPCTPAARRVGVWAMTSGAALAALLISYVPVAVPSTGVPVLIGLTERALLGVDLVLIWHIARALTDAHVIQADQPRSSPLVRWVVGSVSEPVLSRARLRTSRPRWYGADEADHAVAVGESCRLRR